MYNRLLVCIINNFMCNLDWFKKVVQVSKPVIKSQFTRFTSLCTTCGSAEWKKVFRLYNLTFEAKICNAFSRFVGVNIGGILLILKALINAVNS